jgi:hypothetical protein
MHFLSNFSGFAIFSVRIGPLAANAVDDTLIYTFEEL